SVTGGRQEAAAENARPERVRPGEKLDSPGEAEIENREFSRRPGNRDDVIPSSGDLAEDDEEAEYRAKDVQRHLYDIGPDHGRHAAFEGIEEREDCNEDNGGEFAGTEDDRNDDRDGEDAHPLGKRSRHEKNGSGELPDALAKSSPHQFVGGEHLSPEVMRQEQYGNHNSREQVSEHDLEESEISRKGQSGSADDCEGARLGGCDGEGGWPPRRGAGSR